MPPWAWARSWVSRRVGVGGGLALANHTGDFGNARAVESARSSRRTRRGAKCEDDAGPTTFQLFHTAAFARARARRQLARSARQHAQFLFPGVRRPRSPSARAPPRARGPRLSFLRPPPRSVFVFAVVFISLVLFQIQKDDPSRPHQHGGESLAPPHRQRRRRDEPGKRAIPRPPRRRALPSLTHLRRALRRHAPRRRYRRGERRLRRERREPARPGNAAGSTITTAAGTSPSPSSAPRVADDGCSSTNTRPSVYGAASTTSIPAGAAIANAASGAPRRISRIPTACRSPASAAPA